MKQISLGVDDELHRAAKVAAAAVNRSLANWIRCLIEAAVEKGA